MQRNAIQQCNSVQCNAVHCSSCIEPRALFPLPAIVSPLAWRLSFLLQGSRPFPGRPFFLSTCIALRRAPRRPHARTFASPRTDDRRTNDSTCGPQAWLADTERTLTAAAGPSPRDPYRHALAMRPPQKARPFVSLTTAMQCNAMQSNTIQCTAMQCNSVQ